MSENILFRPTTKVVMECEYFQTKNDIFDLDLKVKVSKRLKKNGKFVKGEFVSEYRNLDSQEMLTYIYLCRCANNKDNAFPSYNGIAKHINCSRAKAQDCIKVLSQNGFIYKENRCDNKGNYTSNIYYINIELKELKVKLDNLCDTKEMAISQEQGEVYCQTVQGILSDSTGVYCQTVQGILSDSKEKEQAKKNNIEKEQYKNNNIEKSQNKVETKTNIATKKETIVVVDKDIKLLKMYLDSNNLNIEFSQKDLKAISKVLITKHGSIDSTSVKVICNLIKSSTKPIKNIIGFILSAIENNYEEQNYIPVKDKKDEKFLNDLNKRIEEKSKLRFCDYEQRDYDYDKLERKLLGWDDSEDTKSEENESFGTPKVNLVDAEIKSELKIDDDGTKYNQLTV